MEHTDSVSSGHFKISKAPRTRGSILGLLEEVVRVGHVMRYKMEGCKKAKKEWVKELCNKHKVNFLSLQETKMEYMDTLCVKRCWGNMAFEFVHSDAVGNSGGILCEKYMLIAIYAPHELNDKHRLLEYLQCEIKRWRGEVVVMGDFNEVRHTYLSDHRPILLREVILDYGPTPFKIFHYWFDINGFRGMVEDAWKVYPCKDTNDIKYLMGKLKYLQGKIREWKASHKTAGQLEITELKRNLARIDDVIDSGNGNGDVISERVDIVSKLHDIENIQASEIAQKSKVKWAVEGDENSGFFHVKKEFYDHFKQTFYQPGPKGASIQIEFPNRISEEEFEDIECDVTNEEIKRAVWECGTDKAPGPDGFTFG
nr:RNA-directed DNA polymerase, eukaryota [Tanacetum cinerariifolium]